MNAKALPVSPLSAYFRPGLEGPYPTSISPKIAETPLNLQYVGDSKEKPDITEKPRNVPYFYGHRNQSIAGVSLESNQASRLIPGHLLVVFRERCYRVDPDTAEIELCFQLRRSPSAYWWMAVPDAFGSVYCSLSGITTESEPAQYAVFGQTVGEIVRVDPRRGDIATIATGARFLDPFGIQLLDDFRLLIADFQGWGGSGVISVMDTRTGAVEVLAEGGLLVDSQMAVLDQEGVLWVANAMHQQYDGEVLRIDPGNSQKVILPRRGPGGGIVSGIFPSSTPDEILAVVIDWPFMNSSCVLAIDKRSGRCDQLLGSSRSEPAIYNAHGVVRDSVLWIGESYNNKLLGYDLKKRKVVSEVDMSPILGRSKGFGIKGIYDSFDFLECIHLIPEQRMAP